MTGKVAIVTGGASGIGLATCRRLLDENFDLAVFDLSKDGAQSAAGPQGLGLDVDVADETAVEKAVATVLERFGRVDVLVNNAGITGSQAASVCHTTPIDEWDRVFDVNVRAPFLCTRAVLPTMLEQGAGQIITIASGAGIIAFPGRCAYVASKGAALMFAKSVAVDYARHGIRSNAICPGIVQTPMSKWRLDIPELRQQVEAQIPMGRPGEPDEIADAVAVLASGRLQYMNGCAWLIDGGWTAL